MKQDTASLENLVRRNQSFSFGTEYMFPLYFFARFRGQERKFIFAVVLLLFFVCQRYVLKQGEPRVISGKQEKYESILNAHV